MNTNPIDTTEKLNGPLYNTAAKPNIKFTPYMPAADVAFYIERYWYIAWDLTDQPPFCTDHLPDPSVHVVVENGLSGVFGAARGKFERWVEGAGYAFCIKFRPGAFHPFTPAPMSILKNRLASLEEIFGADGLTLKTDIRRASSEAQRIEIGETFIRAHQPPHDETVALIHRLIDCIVTDRHITKAHYLEAMFSLSTRTLQRLFMRSMGVSPSWVIRRYRIHEAVAQLDQGHIVDWPALAVDLGYFDQAHFIKDFKKIIGMSPGEYQRRSQQ